mgnify:CR=1 FL=1
MVLYNKFSELLVTFETNFDVSLDTVGTISLSSSSTSWFACFYISANSSALSAPSGSMSESPIDFSS